MPRASQLRFWTYQLLLQGLGQLLLPKDTQMMCKTGTWRKELFVIFDVGTSREVRAPVPAIGMLRHHPYLDVWPAVAMAWFDFRHRLAVKGL